MKQNKCADQLSCAVTAQLTSTFVFTYAKGRFSHDTAHMMSLSESTPYMSMSELPAEGEFQSRDHCFLYFLSHVVNLID